MWGFAFLCFRSNWIPDSFQQDKTRYEWVTLVFEFSLTTPVCAAMLWTLWLTQTKARKRGCIYESRRKKNPSCILCIGGWVTQWLRHLHESNFRLNISILKTCIMSMVYYCLVWMSACLLGKHECTCGYYSASLYYRQPSFATGHQLLS